VVEKHRAGKTNNVGRRAGSSLCGAAQHRSAERDEHNLTPNTENNVKLQKFDISNF
jgi:hypothetical protein